MFRVNQLLLIRIKIYSELTLTQANVKAEHLLMSYNS